MWHFPHYNVLFFKCNISVFTVIESRTKCLGTGDIKYKRSILKDVSQINVAITKRKALFASLFEKSLIALQRRNGIACEKRQYWNLKKESGFSVRKMSKFFLKVWHICFFDSQKVHILLWLHPSKIYQITTLLSIYSLIGQCSGQ